MSNMSYCRFRNTLHDGATYLLRCRGHILAVVNGQNMDWTRGRALRVWDIVRIRKIGGASC